MKKSKKALLLLLSIFSIVAITTSLTIAWFSAHDTATNIATMGNLDVDVTESSTEPDAVITENGITYTDPRMPGDSLSKVIRAVNTGNQDLYIRFVVTKAWYDADTGLVAPGTDPSFIELLNIDASKYVVVTEGNTTYYYLKAPLAAGATDMLFDSFKIAEATTNAHIGLQARIIVATDAVQYDHGVDAVAAQGWHVHVDAITLELTSN